MTARHFDLPATWSRWCADARCHAVDSGHFLPEEAPEETLAHLSAFLSGQG